MWVVILIGRATWEICFRVVIRQQYGISSLVSQTSFLWQTGGMASQNVGYLLGLRNI